MMEIQQEKEQNNYLVVIALVLVAFLGVGFYLYQQLKKAKGEVEQLNASKTRLYTNITHEFRTPLTVILGLTDQIKDHDKETGLIRQNGKNFIKQLSMVGVHLFCRTNYSF